MKNNVWLGEYDATTISTLPSLINECVGRECGGAFTVCGHKYAVTPNNYGGRVRLISEDGMDCTFRNGEDATKVLYEIMDPKQINQTQKNLQNSGIEQVSKPFFDALDKFAKGYAQNKLVQQAVMQIKASFGVIMQATTTSGQQNPTQQQQQQIQQQAKQQANGANNGQQQQQRIQESKEDMWMRKMLKKYNIE